MTLNSSGQLSLGGSTTGQSIEKELGIGPTTQASFNDSNFRTLAGKSSGQIALNNFYGKSSAITVSSLNNNVTVLSPIGIAVNPSGKFMVVGAGSGQLPKSATTTNGSSWTAVSSIGSFTSNDYIRAVAWHPVSNLWVAVGGNNSAYQFEYAYSSNDGASWTTGSAGPSGGISPPFCLAINPSGVCVSVGNNYSGGSPVVYYSTNGTSWSYTTLSSINHIEFTSVCWDSSAGVFVAVGSYSTIGNSYNAVYMTSSNGSSWSAPSLMGTAWSPYRVVCNSNGLLLAVGSSVLNNSSGSAGNASYSLSSNGGSTWSTPATFNSVETVYPANGYNIVAVATPSNRFFVMNYQGSGNLGYTSSSDGTTWAPWAAFPGTADDWSSVAASSSNLIVGVGSYYGTAIIAQG